MNGTFETFGVKGNFNGLLNSELPKRPTSMQFTADGQIILVSDKFGDVFRQVTFSPSSLLYRSSIFFFKKKNVVIHLSMSRFL